MRAASSRRHRAPTSKQKETLRLKRLAELKAVRKARNAEIAQASGKRIFTFETLHLKGVPFSPEHLRRLVTEGAFPAPIYIGKRTPAWPEDVLDAWLESKKAAAE